MKTVEEKIQELVQFLESKIVIDERGRSVINLQMNISDVPKRFNLGHQAIQNILTSFYTYDKKKNFLYSKDCQKFVKPSFSIFLIEYKYQNNIQGRKQQRRESGTIHESNFYVVFDTDKKTYYVKEKSQLLPNHKIMCVAQSHVLAMKKLEKMMSIKLNIQL
jgi:hypothetical protein